MDTLTVAQYTVQNNGGTFSHALGTVEAVSIPTDPTKAWLVAVEPHHSGKNTVTHMGSMTDIGWEHETIITGAVWDFIRHHHDGFHMFGTWIADGKLYIDHVIFTTLETATRIAKERGEKAIYNLSTGATHTL